MFGTLLILHSLLRWAVLAGLLLTIYRVVKGWQGGLPFSRLDNTLRHVSATLAHIQLAIGAVLYFESPVVKGFRQEFGTPDLHFDYWFFGLIHMVLMTISVVLITIGSSLAKRQDAPQAKFRTLTLWYLAALLVILVAIPWPFSPLASRPWLRLW